ncbi:hypothetical protein PTSG_07589 [Salpingoeca rosetta]|uniref:Uncharacterized protein n=1 Tax=Salpingoeca rosetta (strain ATCC 50818 / BSB-021) TaxID=946362 RepID=F2UH73_SALR5|nr:uncharacterized protein PTSG_07589 [Salpingoeca rosetta]EGD76473.1 hypothetical protein PTSG_07589 [Salpingoeca rosetta]|eukprot:XP_004991387.1 hypothetical protein PTSG_07589 [Salpingoeca rosetta]
MGMGVVDKDEILRELMSVLEDGSSCNVNMTGVKKEEEEEESDATLFDSLSQGAVKEEWEWEKEEEEVCTELPQEHSAHEEERGRKKKKQRKTSKAKNLPAVRSNNKRALDARWDEEMLRHKDFNGVVKPYIERHLSKADRTHFMKARRRYLNRTYREKKLEREPSAAKAVRLQAEENGRLQQELDTQEQCLEDLRAKINALKEFMRQSDIPF